MQMSQKYIEENHCLYNNATDLEFKNNKFKCNINDFLRLLVNDNKEKRWKEIHPTWYYDFKNLVD